MSNLPWFKFYPSDWLSGTRGMTAAETGIYITLIANMYDHRKALVRDDARLARMCGASKKAFTEALNKLLADGKIQLTEGGLWNARVGEELQQSEFKSQKTRRAAEIRFEEKTQENQGPPDADALQMQCYARACQKPEARSQKPDSSSIAVSPVPTADPEKPVAAEAPRAARVVEIGRKLTDLMGVTDDPRWTGNWAIVTVWLASGFDAELDIFPAVAARVDAMKRGGKAMPASLKYFTNIIRDHHESRMSGALPAPKVTAEAVAEYTTVKKGTPQFTAWMKHYRSLGRKTAFSEGRGEATVPTEWPPGHEQARTAA